MADGKQISGFGEGRNAERSCPDVSARLESGKNLHGAGRLGADRRPEDRIPVHKNAAV